MSDSVTTKKETAEDLNKDDNLELLSMEKLDRESPEIWAEKIPGVNVFAAMNNISGRESNDNPPPWTKGLSQEDINSMHQIGALSPAGLTAEIKKLYDQAYQLGIEEAREMTRGKYLNIFSQSTRRK